ncbi:hypothetical protein [Bacillus cereus]|uniref:hypothetical protein n=1 Tax=Bacillus cereus TaxID=1396 RepID=UPI0013FD3BDF|nr:hypothetical protein [Bacillus cereus]
MELPTEKRFFASTEGAKWPEILAVGTGYKIKVEAARPEWKGDEASDVEALFASQEDAKPPTILAAGTGYI